MDIEDIKKDLLEMKIDGYKITEIVSVEHIQGDQYKINFKLIKE